MIFNKHTLSRQAFLVAALCVGTSLKTTAQNPWERMARQPATLHTEAGAHTFETSAFRVDILNSSQTISRLAPLSETSFDFTPSDRLELRDIDGCYQLGDINFRLRTQGEWIAYSSAKKRNDVKPLSPSGDQLAVADLAPTLGDDLPLQVIRSWERKGGDLILKFELKNTSASLVEIGALGVPMVFNNILEGKSLEETHVENVFFDPYIGKDAGYLQVVRLHGKGPVLLVLPEQSAGFEAYRPLNDDPTPRGIVFEGFLEWMVHSKAYAETEWTGVDQWNTPTSKTLKPGETAVYAWRFVEVPSVKDIEPQLIEKQRPVAVGIPGYVIPTDVNGKLFLHYGKAVESITAEPAGVLQITPSASKTPGDWNTYEVKGLSYGRSLVTVTYADGAQQTINYKVIHDEATTIRNMGSFLLTDQWYEDAEDPFHRSPSPMNYDYDTKKIVLQDSRAWIVGLGDEGGSGPYLASIMKQLLQPDQQEINKLIRFIDETLWGGIQYSDGDRKYGVRKSLFYYEPDKMPAGTYSDSINYKTWAAWNQEHAESPERSYNYPHVTAAHWVMYRLARYHQDLVKNRSWQWYLENAYHTAKAMMEQAPYYAQFGQMEGTVFVMLLKDLQKEGLTEMAADLETTMKSRADHWKSLPYPFGSEMPWDSTGQEEVYMWSKYFGYDEKAEITLNAILAYMPTVPHWGYNGSARRYWDFLYGGKLSRVERQLHHYGSALNAIPVLYDYRENPSDLYQLRVGHAGMMGALANITSDGFGPAAFHSYPSTLQIDGLSGDYGSGFFGYAVNTSSYLIHDPVFGWLSFGGNVTESEKEITIAPTTASRQQVYIAPAGLWISLNAGEISAVAYNTQTGDIRITLAPRDAYTALAYLEFTTTSGSTRYTAPASASQTSRGYTIKLKKKETTFLLTANR